MFSVQQTYIDSAVSPRLYTIRRKETLDIRVSTSSNQRYHHIPNSDTEYVKYEIELIE